MYTQGSFLWEAFGTQKIRLKQKTGLRQKAIY